MTKKEIIATIETNQAKINELNKEISLIQSTTKYLVNEYIKNESKYKVGEIVNIITEKYKVPRKYIVQHVWGVDEKQNDGTIRVIIFYDLATANGFVPKGGWSIEEKDLKLAK